MRKIYVVEGIRDEEILKKIDPNIFTIKTNGFSFDNELIEKLIELEKEYEIVLILDPDYPGEKIRRELTAKLKNPINIFIPQDKAISKNQKKVGLEHVSLDDLAKILEKEIIFDKKIKGNLNTSDFITLGLTGNVDSEKKRLIVTNHYYLPKSNAKRLLNYLNNMNISYKELEEVLNES
jgi:ribonuclease M5